MIKFLSFSLAIFALMIIIVSQSFAKIIVLERLKTESVVLKATGEGIYPDDSNLSQTQKKLMAKRAATVDAYRKLLEKVNEIEISSETTIRDFLIEKDEVTTKVSGFIRGAKIMEVRDNQIDMVEVDMIIELGKDFYDIIAPYIKQE